MVYAPRLEPLGLGVLEANACGLPVVAVAEGGVRETIVDGSSLSEILGDAAIYFDPDSIHEIAAAMERLVSDTALRSQLVERG
jgi:glycosyltransferase involved in cell wall biosynthesis